MRVLALCVLAAISLPGLAQNLKTRHIVLVTADGLRWQDLFGGIDPLLADDKSTGMTDAAALRKELWRDTPEERRKALMPFFWNTLVPKGMVLGNLKRGSSVRVTNRYRISYPGYAEILTGRAQDDKIHGNVSVQNPIETVLEFVKRKLELDKNDVALYSSWETLSYIGESKPGSVFINAGYQEDSRSIRSPLIAALNAAQLAAKTPWDSARHDYFTFELGFDYLKTVHPRLLYFAFDETDDWAHDRRYDRVLESIQYFDQTLETLWNWIQESPDYRGNTTLIVSCDHGRGGAIDDWHSHGPDVKGDEQIWIAAIGPDTPATGEARNVPEVQQRDIAPTILALLGIDYKEYTGVLGRPIPLALPAK